MKLCFTSIVAALTLLSSSSVAQEASTEQASQSQAIFNGTDLSGWHGRPHFDPAKFAALAEADQQAKKAEWMVDAKQHWTVENGELVNDGKGVYLVTDKEYRDYELHLKYKTVAGADSGIYLKGCPQVQIWDSTDKSKFKIGADKGSGALWNNSPGAPGKDPIVKADRPFGEWNDVRVLQVGARTSVWLNDKMVVDHAIMENYWNRDMPLYVRGPIELQTHGGEIRWKDIQVRELTTAEANAELASHGNEGFKSLFNGSDLAGWTGATNSYEVVDGAIMCKKGTGGNLLTENQYSDFVVRLEFQLPPGGNNGLAIRAPMSGNPAYKAMCELQVLDNTSPKYAKLDTRQYHGSAYGMVAAKRGFLRPVGEWNFQEVTVKGNEIKVELNGTVILDADLSKVTEFMADSEHPGLDRKQGHFGFAGHSDPVLFRNISIDEL